jgi:hypothetical protein
MPLLSVWAAELWTASGINKHITTQITNKTQVIVDAGNVVCCYAHIPVLSVKSLHLCVEFLFQKFES